MKNNRFLILGGYLMTVYLCTVPILETFSGLVPTQAGEPGWRYGAVGLVTQAMMTPLLGLLLAVSIAVALRHKAILILLGVLSGLGAIVTLVVIPLFVMDAVQMRGLVQEDSTQAFDLISILALAKLLATALMGGLMALAVRVVLGEMGRQTKAERPDSTAGIVVPKPTRRESPGGA